MADFLNEIDEDLRHEKYKKLWARYGQYAIIAIILLILSVVGFQAWRFYEVNQQHALSEELDLLLDSQTSQLPDLQKYIKESRDGYQLVAALQAIAQMQPASDERLQLLLELSQSDLPKRYRDLATLLKANDTKDFDTVVTFTNANSPWRELALGFALNHALANNNQEQIIHMGQLLVELRPHGQLANLAQEVIHSLEKQ